MRASFLKFIALITVAVSVQSCLEQKYNKYLESLEKDSTQVADPVLAELKFPEEFDFSTETTVRLSIFDDTANVVYEVYPVTEDLTQQLDSIVGPLDDKLLERPTLNGSILEDISIPAYVEELFLVRKTNAAIVDITIPIEQNMASYTFNGSSGKSNIIQSKNSEKSNLDCANVFGQRSYINMGNIVTLDDPGVHTISNIQFPRNGATAIIRATDFDGAEFKNRFSLAGAGFAPPIYSFYGFNFWISSKIDTNNNPSGYVEFEMDFDTPVQHILMHVRSVDASRYHFVGAQHTETLISGGRELEYNESQRVLRDVQPRTRGRYYRDGYGTILISATSGTFNKIVWRRIDEPEINVQNDSNWFTFTEVEICNDQDGDGAVDSVDEFPTDPTRAYSITYPAKDNMASLVFEDLWPFRGDWDFNDTSIDYSITRFLNTNGDIVAIDIDYIVTSDGAGFVNSLAFEIGGLDPNNVFNVTGQSLEREVFSLDANGVELGQNHAVIPLFDDHSILVNQENQINIELISPIQPSSLVEAPFNPFLVANGDREKEIHLLDHSPTSLGNALPSVEGNNADSDGNYATDNGLPWAINVVESFPLLIEKEPINEGYLYFEEWGRSGGTTRKNWYKNFPGYRNFSKLRQ